MTATNRRVSPALTATLLGTMTATSFQIFAFAVLAVEIIDEFGLSRAELGLISASNTLVGGLTAPWSGRLTDWMGPKQAAVSGIVVSAVGTGLMAIAPSVWILAASAILLGLPQGWGNPATNALIAERVPVGRRGVITGIKQSGVQFGVFLSGITLPGLALWFGWRGAMWTYAAVFAVVAVAVALGLAPGGRPEAETSSTGRPADPAPAPVAETVEDARSADAWIRRVALFALCAGTVGGAVSRFYPLWVQEVVGLEGTTAGILVALGGFIGMGARVVAGRVAEERIAPARLLTILALIGSTYCLSLAVTLRVGVWILWPGTVLNAVGIGAWNAVAMLAVIMAVPAGRSGRASGVVMFGFLTGLAVGAPLAGFVVDVTGSYQPVWWTSAALMVVAAALPALGSASAHSGTDR